MYRQYSRTSSSGSSSENLPPRTLARLAREIRDIHKDTPDGIHLMMDGDCGGSLGELVVSIGNHKSCQHHHHDCSVSKIRGNRHTLHKR
jgi:hypothetical protein